MPPTDAPPTPVQAVEEYIEQAYFFRNLRERQADGRPTQETLDQVRHELLATTRLPFAVDFMLTEAKHSGKVSQAFAGLAHYFTPFQAHVVGKAEEDHNRFTFAQALLILEREAEYRADGAAPAGLFIYQLEALTRNQLGYLDGLRAMQHDGFYSPAWQDYIRVVRASLGVRDVAFLIFARSEFFVRERRAAEPEYEPSLEPLFGLKEGQIAFATQGKDPNYLFAALQRQLGYPPVPRPPRVAPETKLAVELERRVKALETKLKILEGEITGRTDPKALGASGGRPA